MKQLSNEQIEFAVGHLQQLVESRGLSQTQLEESSGIAQSTISKILKRSLDPSPEALKKLYRAIGQNLSHIVNDTEVFGHELIGYLATPLTGLATSEDAELRKLVDEVKGVLARPEFHDPRFDLYWPGDYTHPVKNLDIRPNQVYLIDRARASTYDFIIILCAAPSYGVGQENEIATQAGLSAIRIVPKGMSRMMTGSFINAINIEYEGTLSTRIAVNQDELVDAIGAIRRAHYRRQAFYKGQTEHNFGERLSKLINERGGDYNDFADDLGINLLYLHALMQEPFNVSNPSIRLLRRMAALLGESVSYLIGESEQADSVWIDSQASFRAWLESKPHLPAGNVFQMRDQWRQDYRLNKTQPVSVSSRKPTTPMTVSGWDRLYRECYGKGGNGASHSLFEK